MSSEVIYVEKGAVTAIAKELGCCTMTVCHALKGRGKGHSKLKKMIRRIARERYAGSDHRKEVKRGERIVVPQGANIAIAMNMGVNIVTVRKALKGYANTALARRIREEALKNFGGKRVDAEGKFLDGVSFWGDTMVQKFGSGIELVANRRTGEVKIYRKKKLIDSALDPTIEVLMAMQEKAMRMAEEKETENA